jgi:hypothetical protein
MSAQDRPAGQRGERLSFFQQSGWMLLATVVAGACFAMVHAPASRMVGPGEWDLFVALLDSLYILGLPAVGLQAVFARVTAGAIDETRRRQVRGAVRQVLAGMFLLWLVVALIVFSLRSELFAGLKVANPWAVWLTLGVGLMMLWSPVFAGLLQGSQRFFWLGNMVIAGGAGRLAGIMICVLLLRGQAAAAIGGVLAGWLAGLAIAVWASRNEWRGVTGAFPWKPWFGQLLGLTFGLAPLAIMMAGDTLLVQAAFDEKAKSLVLAAGRIARGMVNLTTPMALVLFPRVARSAATGEATGVLKLALGATLGVGAATALGCTLLPSIPLQVLFAGNKDFADATRYVPWAVWGMLPLAASTTLIHHLLARGEFRCVPWLLMVAGGYALTLILIRDRLSAQPVFDAFREIILILGFFNLLLLSVAVLFSWRRAGAKRVAPRA